MTDLKCTTAATKRIEEARRLIQDAQAARQRNEPQIRTVQAEIEGTQRASEMMANLALLIGGITDSTSRA